MTCKVCDKRAYSEYCIMHKPRKPIRKKGKRTLKYKKWRDAVARPHLDSKGRFCQLCYTTENLDVDHIKKRGSHPDLIMSLSNVRYICRQCHIKIT